MKHALAIFLTAAALGSVACNKGAEKRPVAADNTQKNERDRSGDTLTPGDQGESEADRDITAKIRRDVVGDQQLGMTAKNVKIITRDSVVTLRGAVSTAEERALIESYAKRASGVRSVDDQLEIASK